MVCGWKYGPGLGLYDLGTADMEPILLPSLNYYSVCRAGELVGLACFGKDAQVFGGPYGPAALDLGCNLAPLRVGKGEGRDFVGAVVDFADRAFKPPLLRLSVAQANGRAIHVYEQNGFAARGQFAGMTRGGIHRFLLMTRRRR